MLAEHLRQVANRTPKWSLARRASCASSEILLAELTAGNLLAEHAAARRGRRRCSEPGLAARPGCSIFGFRV